MRILMLGWEFPPFKAGGLGTACFGLTRALDRAGHEIVFVLPRPTGGASADHVQLLGPDAVGPILTDSSRLPQPEPAPGPTPGATEGPGAGSDAGLSAAVEHAIEVATTQVATSVGAELGTEAASEIEDGSAEAGGSGGSGAADGIEKHLKRTRFYEIAAPFVSPYGGLPAEGSEAAQRLRTLIEQYVAGEQSLQAIAGGLPASAAADTLLALDAITQMTSNQGDTYTSDLFGDAERYARIVAALAQRIDFDVVHAHDWLAYPAGMAVKARTGKPLVCHMHATEFDRSGDAINQQVYDIERAGMHAADRVIAVSQLTREIVLGRYGVDPAKTDVVYNGVDKDEDQPAAGATIASDDKIVLFLGRITMQKGPEYFIRAAKRAIEKIGNIKFVVAGSGDMAVRMIEEAAALGIGHKVLFTGFLRGRDVQRVFSMADCYVMPSVSEPFGIAALEAIQQGTPVIISKQSGVSEVLSHALKVDFWDVDDIANKIVAVLRHPPLSQTLREHGPMELRALTWADAARKTAESYRRARNGH